MKCLYLECEAYVLGRMKMRKNDQFNDLENAVMHALLDGPDEVLDVLRDQFEVAVLKNREMSGVVFFTRFLIPEKTTKLSPPNTFTIEDVEAEIQVLENGAGFELFVVDGVIDRLEGFCYDETWPELINQFKLYYHGGDHRNFDSLRKRWMK